MMKVSAKTRYAARILLALANAHENVTSVPTIASSIDREYNESAPDSFGEPSEPDVPELPDALGASLTTSYAPPTPMSSHLLAEKTGVTVQFTEQILKALKRGGLTTSTRGAAGGHSLTRAPELISLGEVVHIMEGGVQLASCVSARGTCDDGTTCERADRCAMRTAWSHVTRALEDTLATISLADLLKARGGL